MTNFESNQNPPLPPYLQSTLLNKWKSPYPTAWNTSDKYTGLAISNKSKKISYTGLGKSDADAASVRSNHPIPVSAGIFYWEVTIVSKGRDGYIAIGFGDKGVNLNRLPGWDPQSWGYHGDDGHSFCCSGTGPSFTTGDVIGCGVHFMDSSAFFTKNGVFLGVAFKDLKSIGKVYPTVGLRSLILR